jgi:hypothetical protein
VVALDHERGEAEMLTSELCARSLMIGAADLHPRFVFAITEILLECSPKFADVVPKTGVIGEFPRREGFAEPGREIRDLAKMGYEIVPDTLGVP